MGLSSMGMETAPLKHKSISNPDPPGAGKRN